MTEDEVLAVLHAKTAADSQPALSAIDLTTLLSLARRPDYLGRTPADAGWEPTYDVNAAAAEGWRWKSGRVAAGFDISADGTSLSRSQVYAQCTAMADFYATQTAESSSDVPLVDPTWVINA